MFKVNNRNTRARCEICSKLIHRSGVIIVNFEHISHLVLVFLLLTLNMKLPVEVRGKAIIFWFSNLLYDTENILA